MCYLILSSFYFGLNHLNNLSKNFNSNLFYNLQRILNLDRLFEFKNLFYFILFFQITGESKGCIQIVDASSYKGESY